MWGSDRLRAGRQEVGKCSTRGESREMCITFASAKIANKAEPTLALKPRGDVTRNPKQGYQWPQKKDMCPPKTFKKKQKNINNGSCFPQSCSHLFDQTVGLCLVSACAGAGGGSGGVPFEVWCRFYYPNVRDQVMAKVQYIYSVISHLYHINFPFNSGKKHLVKNFFEKIAFKSCVPVSTHL